MAVTRDSLYAYTLTPEDMSKTNNKNIKDSGVNYSGLGKIEPLSALLKDVQRNVTLNGKHVERGDIENPGLDVEEKKFEADLKEQYNFSEANVEKLSKHYSAAPMIFVGAFLFSGCITGDPTNEPISLQAPTIEPNIYQENGELYFKIKTNNYPIARRDDPKAIIGHIEGPVEALFKLTDKGFELQYAKTNSDLLHKMFLGEKITENDILTSRNNHKVLTSIDKQIKTLTDNVKSLESSLAKLPKEKLTKKESKKQTELQLELAAASKALQAVKSYSSNRMDLHDLKTAIQTYQKVAEQAQGRFARHFSRTPPSSTREVLSNMLKVLKKPSKINVFKVEKGLRH